MTNIREAAAAPATIPCDPEEALLTLQTLCIAQTPERNSDVNGTIKQEDLRRGIGLRVTGAS